MSANENLIKIFEYARQQEETGKTAYARCESGLVK